MARLYLVTWGADNGANGQAVGFFTTKGGAQTALKKATKRRREAVKNWAEKLDADPGDAEVAYGGAHTIDHAPELHTIHVSTTRQGIADVLNQWTEPLRAD